MLEQLRCFNYISVHRIVAMLGHARYTPAGDKNPVNLLYYGDNLDVLRRHIKEDTVDLVYLDPPFKSSQDYNVLFVEQGRL